MLATPLIRPVTARDALAVARVHVRAWQEGYRGLIDREYLDGLRAEDRAQRYTFGTDDPPAPTTFVAEIDGVVRGFATIGAGQDREREIGELQALYVDPPVWGAGIGRRLIAHARRELHARGFPEAVLWILVGNERAERFYSLDGWRAEDVTKTEQLWGTTITETRFRRALP
jgi:GNAT superfamily N-acetyltransferase